MLKPGDLVEFKSGAYMLRRYVLSSDASFSMTLSPVVKTSANPAYVVSLRDVGDVIEVFDDAYALSEFTLASDDVLDLEFKRTAPPPSLPLEPIDVVIKRRSPAQIFRGIFPLSCGCVIKSGETCEHGWTVWLW